MQSTAPSSSSATFVPKPAEKRLRWALAQRTSTAAEKLVLLCVASRVSGEEFGRITDDDIANVARIAPEKVKRHVVALEDAGRLETTLMPDGSLGYRLPPRPWQRWGQQGEAGS